MDWRYWTGWLSVNWRMPAHSSMKDWPPKD
jgi:hypothetical protein